jgi:flavin-dependent dehydrogenase
MGYETDVFIVGGGPAGLAAGIAARARGFRAIVADGAAPPITKACGEGLLPDGMLALRQLGVELRESDGYPLRGIQFEDSSASVRAEFPVGHGLGVRREILHQRMMERAEDCGVCFMWNTPITGLRDGGIVAGGNEIRSRWIIGADGSRSRVRQWSGLENFTPGRGRSAFRQHFRVKPWTDFTEIYWADSAQAYVTPVGSEEICVAIISSKPHEHVGDALRSFPKLARRLEGAPLASRERGARTGMFGLKRVCRGNIALIGDASGGVDAITGEGLCLAFRQAVALGDALARGTLETYQEAHRRLFRRPRFIGSLLLLMDRRAGIRKRTMRALEAAPHLFEGMLAYHVGVARLLQLATTGTLLGLRFLTA